MKNSTTTQSRRTFLKATALTGGGMILGYRGQLQRRLHLDSIW